MRVFGRVLMVVLLLGAIGAVGYGVWNAGYQQGLVETVETTVLTNRPSTSLGTAGNSRSRLVASLNAGIRTRSKSSYLDRSRVVDPEHTNRIGPGQGRTSHVSGLVSRSEKTVV
jgi:hypothetical protein